VVLSLRASGDLGRGFFPFIGKGFSGLVLLAVMELLLKNTILFARKNASKNGKTSRLNTTARRGISRLWGE